MAVGNDSSHCHPSSPQRKIELSAGEVMGSSTEALTEAERIAFHKMDKFQGAVQWSNCKKMARTSVDRTGDSERADSNL